MPSSPEALARRRLKGREAQRVYRRDHRAEYNAKCQAYRDKNRGKISTRKRKKYAATPRVRAAVYEWRRMWRQKLKEQVFAHYGGPVCACCGELEFAFLTVDHINGGGNAHRREIGVGQDILRWLVKNGLPPGFQILCYNCNNAKRFDKVCPHESYRRLLGEVG